MTETKEETLPIKYEINDMELCKKQALQFALS